MPPLAQVKTVKAALKSIKQDLAQQHKEIAEKVARDIADQAEKILGKTLRNRGLSPGGGFADASPDSEFKVRVSAKGSDFELRVMMSDGGGVNSPHYVWHLIQFGIPERVQTKTSPPIPVKSPRTKVNAFPVQRAPRTVDEYVVIPKGTPVKETPGRNWYELVGKELESYIQKKHPGWELSSTKVNKP